ncbi:class I adenylate-forming enzyme family protein [Micromonospora sp. WMMD729]|uniref:class I adenylate-forming enzyme family protein n=1 Tax=Micromonospora sp. WMMD729 TaxID=3404127 RepID=UPI003BF5021C
MNAAEDLANLMLSKGWHSRPAYHVDDRTYTHGWVHDMAARVAAVLKTQGVTVGSRVLVVLPDGVEWIVTFLASARLGSVAITVNPDLPANDHAFYVHDCKPDLIVSEGALSGRFMPHAPTISAERLVGLAQDASPEVAAPVGADAPLYVQYTSGTTGTPKGAIHRHSDLVAYHAAVGDGMLGLAEGDVLLSTSKLYFPYGFGNSFVYPLHSGSAVVLRRLWLDVSDVPLLIARRRVTVLFAVPSVYSTLLSRGDPHQFATVRVAISAGEPLTVALGERTSGLIDAPVLNMLGSTEVGGAFCANTVADNELGTVGSPLAGYEVELRDDSGRPAPPDGGECEGHLWVRGSTVMQGYLNRETETESVLVEGWLATADMARRRRDGRYIHLGRSDDLEIVAGLNISPIEVENVLASHPSVREVAVATIPDARGARMLVAFVIPSFHRTPVVEDQDSIRTYLAERLAGHKIPREVRFVTRLPRTPTGKIRRAVIRGGVWNSD